MLGAVVCGKGAYTSTLREGDTAGRVVVGHLHTLPFPIGLTEFQAIQHKLATCRCLVEQAKWLTFHAAGLMDGGNPATGEASMAKLAACRALRETATASSLVHGGYGFMQEYDIQLYFRRAKDVENWCGSLLIDRDLILRSALDPVDQAR